MIPSTIIPVGCTYDIFWKSIDFFETNIRHKKFDEKNRSFGLNLDRYFHDVWEIKLLRKNV